MALNKRRIKIVMAMLTIAVGLLAVRLVYIQLYNSKQLSGFASRKQTKLISGEDVPRGNILDRNGESLTDSKLEPALIVFPPMLHNRDKAAGELAKVLEVSPKAVRAMLANRDHVYFSGITDKKAQAISKLEIYGVYTSYIKTRYGDRSLARHVVGHINSIDADAWAVLNKEDENAGSGMKYNINDAIGVKGIEAEYEDYLHATDPEFFLSAVMDARGSIIPGLSFKEVPAVAGSNKRNSVYLTIDRRMQEKVEEIMDRNIQKGAVVVIDIESGDILAAASRPNYNQNLIVDSLISSDKAFNNSAFEFYNPGSVFKVLIAAAALEEGVVTPNELFICNGKYTLDTGLVINCWKHEGHGAINFVQGFANSCNPVFIETALRLGKDKILEYGEKFGLSDAQLIGYTLSSFKCLDIGSGDGDIANAALGQKGVRISPLQVAGMISVVAGGGYFQPPRLVSEIRDYNGQVLKSFQKGKKDRVISPEVAGQVRKMLKEVVVQGTGKNAWIAEFGSAGKTGSAETGRTGPEGKSIKNVWFAGYVPLQNPKFAIAVLEEEGDSGGGDAAPVFKEIAQYALTNL